MCPRLFSIHYWVSTEDLRKSNHSTTHYCRRDETGERLDWYKAMSYVFAAVWGPLPPRLLFGVVKILNLIRNRVLNSYRMWSPTQLNTPTHPSHKLSVYTAFWLLKGGSGGVVEPERRLTVKYFYFVNMFEGTLHITTKLCNACTGSRPSHDGEYGRCCRGCSQVEGP